MQKIIFLVAGIFLFSCNNESTQPDVSADTIIEDGTAFLNPEDKLPWISEFDTVTGDFILKRQEAVNTDTMTAEGLIRDINAAWDGIVMEYRKISGDTLYVAIPDSRYLTQQMGSAGASGYIASVTFSLTELKNIRYVNYDFEEGDHLSPGTFSRMDFKEYH